MKIFKTKLKDVMKIRLKAFKDHRGKYLETFNKKLFKKTKKKLNSFKMIFLYQKKCIEGILVILKHGS